MIEGVPALIAHDRWTGVEGDVAGAPFLLRYRTPVLQPAQTGDYDLCLRIAWAYAPEESGALPDGPISEAMGVFEDRICAAFEHDAHAVLTAVLTFDGARQWVFYTGDVGKCGERLHAMPQEAERYPIELDAFEDAGWDYLRDEIIRDRKRED